MKQRLIFAFFFLVFLKIQIGKGALLHTAMSDLSATSVLDIALIGAGCGYSGATDEVDIYNYTSKQWTLSRLSVARCQACATSLGHLAFFAGGGLATVDIYDASSNTWLKPQNVSSGRSPTAAGAAVDVALFTGGGNSSDPYGALVDMYNVTTQKWSITYLSEPRFGLTGTNTASLIFFAGGSPGTYESSATVDIFNAHTRSWTVTYLDYSRSYIGACAVGELVFFAGGSDFSGPIDRINVYNTSSSSWLLAGSLGWAADLVSAVGVGNMAVFAGGYNRSALGHVTLYNVASHTWSKAQLSEARYSLGATAMGTTALFAGGSNGGPTAQVDIYDASTNIWYFCDPGQEWNGYGCFNCTEGTVSNGSSVGCLPCDGGSYAPEGSSVCLPCAAGFQSYPSAGFCNACPTGTFSSPGSSSCQNCSAGSYSDAMNSSTCSSCPANTFSDQPGASECTQCANGTCSSGGTANCSIACPVALTTSGSSTSSDVPSRNVSSSSTNNTYIIIGACVGGGCLLLLILLIVFLIVRKRKRRAQSLPETSEGSVTGYELSTLGVTTPSAYSSIPSEHSPYSTIPFTEGAINADVVEGGSERAQNSWDIKATDLTIQAEIGRGAFGVVFKGVYRHQAVAIKRVTAQGAVSPAAVQEFSKEASLMMRLKPHKNLLALLGICWNPMCIVTEFLSGGTLAGYVRRPNITFHLSALLEFSKQIAAGMSHLHAEGIVHRDLAARNILLTEHLEVKISDFGLSRVLGGNDSDFTQSNVGPLKWMAPESVSRREYSFKSDVWAYGVTIIEMLTRREPYTRMLPLEAAIAASNFKLFPATFAPSFTPPHLISLIERCTQHEPQERPDFEMLCVQIAELCGQVESDIAIPLQV